MYGGLGVSAPSLHRECTDSLMYIYKRYTKVCTYVHVYIHTDERRKVTVVMVVLYCALIPKSYILCTHRLSDLHTRTCVL